MFEMAIDDAGLLAAHFGGFSDRAAYYDGDALIVDDPDLAAQIGDVIADPGWRDALALSHAKAVRRADVSAKRDQIVGTGYQHNFGGTAGIRTLDQRDARDETAWLTVKINAMEAVSADAGATQLAIRDANNETFTVSATVASSAMSAMAQWRSAVSQHSWDLKDAIKAAADAAALAAIDIETGWPG